MADEKIIRLAKKLHALAEGGIEGEAESAKRQLDRLLERHGLELGEICDITRQFEMTSLNESSTILDRVIKSVAPKAVIHVEQHKSRLTIKVALSDIEYKEIKQKYAFFWKAYNEERKILLSAFLNKNYKFFMPESKLNKNNSKEKIFSPDDIPRDIDEDKTIVPMNNREISKMEKMMMALNDLNYTKTSKLIDIKSNDNE